ncbi:transcription repressor OFP14-like [Phoenix dactylifera]|uniref:Transcription repressor n=1 Tax=Phoenix dactylifera TaxID=42345 RepID=A0A8B8J5Z7_PHODC|nr:transcription repressor OFP14-like [Phoenix dactylifera]
MHRSLYLSLPKRKKSASQPPLLPTARNYNNIKTSRYVPGPASERSPRSTETLPEPIRASERFFVKPGSSSSLIEEARLSVGSLSPRCEGQAVGILSRDPDADFRRSMLEMVEARHVDPEEPLDWEFVEELLYCFLRLNDRGVHKHIVRAFTDLAAAGFRRRSPRL